MQNQIKHLIAVVSILGLFGIASQSAHAAIQITDTVGPSGKFLVTGMPVSGPANAIVKMVFGNLTSGTNLELCAGSTADFNSGTCALTLSSSGGPGFNFLTIVDVGQLNGKVLFVRRAVGTATAKFSLTVD